VIRRSQSPWPHAGQVALAGSVMRWVFSNTARQLVQR
jgi:hypothetical protein